MRICICISYLSLKRPKKKDQLQLNATIHLHLKAYTRVNLEHSAFLHQLKTWQPDMSALTKRWRHQWACASVTSLLPDSQFVKKNNKTKYWPNETSSLKWYIIYFYCSEMISEENTTMLLLLAVNNMVKDLTSHRFKHVCFHFWQVPVADTGYC